MRSGALHRQKTTKARDRSPGRTSGSQRGGIRNDSQDTGYWQLPPSARGARRRRLRRRDEQFVPLLSYRTGAYAVNGVPFANGVVRLLHPDQRARRRHQRRQAHRRGMRDRLRHRQGRGVLRAPEGQGPDRRGILQSAVDRHHLRADREGAGRQDPDHHDGLRPRRTPRTAPCSPGTSRCSAPTGRRPTSPSSTSPRSWAASTS